MILFHNNLLFSNSIRRGKGGGEIKGKEEKRGGRREIFKCSNTASLCLKGGVKKEGGRKEEGGEEEKSEAATRIVAIDFDPFIRILIVSAAILEDRWIEGKKGKKKKRKRGIRVFLRANRGGLFGNSPPPISTKKERGEREKKRKREEGGKKEEGFARSRRTD